MRDFRGIVSEGVVLKLLYDMEPREDQVSDLKSVGVCGL